MGRDDPPFGRERSEWTNGGYSVVVRSRVALRQQHIPPHWDGKAKMRTELLAESFSGPTRSYFVSTFADGTTYFVCRVSAVVCPEGSKRSGEVIFSSLFLAERFLFIFFRFFPRGVRGELEKSKCCICSFILLY